MIKLYKGDCMQILKGIPSKSVDLVIIDPPYEIDVKKISQEEIESQKYQQRKNKLKQSNYLTSMSNGFNFEVLDELVRVMKKINIYIFCSKNQIFKIYEYFKNLKCNFDILCWKKTNALPVCNNTYMNDTEFCLFFREKGVNLYGNYKTKAKVYISPTTQKEKRKYKHPTIKPLKMIENFVINSSFENDVVLDCFMGSGTTGVACKNLNRNFIGIEKEKEYFEIAQKRIEEN